MVGDIRPDLIAVEDALRRADGAYHLETVTPQGTRTLHLIRSISHVIGWERGVAPLLAAGADPAVRIVSFTVTEAGYHLAPDGELDPSSADLAGDLTQGSALTIYGAVARMLQERMAQEASGLTLLCCDNLRENGGRFRSGLFEFLDRRGDALLRGWAQARCSFPNSMVDRITPRPTDALRARVRAATGCEDGAAVMAEDYVQWVIEDDFREGRPRLEQAGVEFVASVEPYEDAKIRVLNASHALLAWRGAALGLDYIHECIASPDPREAMVRYVTDDVMACLPDSPVDLAAYRDKVISRFGNPHIQDTVARVAADGFAKIAGWIRPTLAERLEAGAWPTATASIASAFLTVLELRAAGRLGFIYADQNAPAALLQAIAEAPDPVEAFAHNVELWGELAGRSDFVALLRQTRVGWS